MAFEQGMWQRINKPAAPQAGDTITLSTSWQAFATSVIIPASAFFLKRSFKVETRGIVNITVAANIQAGVFLGTTMIASTPSTSVGLLTNGGHRGELDFDVMSVGTGGTIEAQGDALFSIAAGTPVAAALVNTSQITGINMTQDQTLTLQVKAVGGIGAGTIQLRMLRAFATMVQ